MSKYTLIGGKAIDSLVIKELESDLGVLFPNEYKAIVTKHNGASFIPFRFKVGDKFESINNLHNLEEKYHFRDDRLPKGIIPFARDAGDSQICFDYRYGDIKIIFWDYGSPRNNGLDLVLVANSFKEFLDKLIELDE